MNRHYSSYVLAANIVLKLSQRTLKISHAKYFGDSDKQDLVDAIESYSNIPEKFEINHDNGGTDPVSEESDLESGSITPSIKKISLAPKNIRKGRLLYKVERAVQKESEITTTKTTIKMDPI